MLSDRCVTASPIQRTSLNGNFIISSWVYLVKSFVIRIILSELVGEQTLIRRCVLRQQKVSCIKEHVTGCGKNDIPAFTLSVEREMAIT